MQSAPPEIGQMRWYHTLELPGGVVTPGEYDLRRVAQRLPWPSLEGKRCLDVGGRDGFYAFEMERRGAAEVVSLDVSDPEDIDFPGRDRPAEQAIRDELVAGNTAFDVARQALGSQARRELCSVYRISPEQHGTFDFAVMGTLALHLRDPVEALGSVRRVLNGRLLLNDAIWPGLDLFRRRPVAVMQMKNGPYWWVANPAGLRGIVEAAGFEVIRTGRPYLVPYGSRAGNAVRSRRDLFRGPLLDLPMRIVRQRGMLHAWILADAG